MKDECVADRVREYFVWYTKNDKVKPENGDMLLIAIWYDGWNYMEGIYSSEEDKIISLEKDRTKFDLNDCDTWLVFPEPKFEY